MKRSKRWLGALALLFIASGVWSAEPPAKPPVVVNVQTPTGAFQSAWITLRGGAWPKLVGRPAAYDELRIRLTFRDGKGTSAWICSPLVSNSYTTWIDRTDVTLDTQGLKGTLAGITFPGLNSPHRNPFEYTLDAKLVDGKLSGTYTGKIINHPGRVGHIKVTEHTVSGSLSGELVTDTTKDALPSGQNWPRYYGVTGGMEGPPTKTPMITDISQARPVWKSEETLPVAWGNGPDWRYGPHPIMMRRLNGGASSPVVADGIIYQYYYFPTDGTEPALDYGGTQSERGWEAQKNAWDNIPLPQRIRDFNSPHAHDVLVAIDAATGKTLWKAVCEKAGGNVQTHKWRWWNCGPCVHEGVVYHQGNAGFVAAFDGKTGKLLWQYTGMHKPATKSNGLGNYENGHSAMGAGPVIAGDCLIVSLAGDHHTKLPSKTVALDPKTGQVKWENTQVTGNMHPWSHGGKNYVLVAGRNAAVALDVTNGKEVFKLPPEAGAAMEQCPLICGDYWLGETTVKGKDGTIFTLFQLKPTGAEKLWSVEQTSADQRWATLTANYVYLISTRGLTVIENKTGKETAKLPQGDGHRTCLAIVAGNRLIIQPEGQHGGQSFKMFDLSDPAQPKPLGAAAKERKFTKTEEVEFDNSTLWHPPHPFTTAYTSQPLTYPVVDGRIFIRGAGGLYCYDLREPAPKK